MNLDLSAEIRFRCPHCQKLFCTDSQVFDKAPVGASATEDTNPLFECTDCKKEFYLLRRSENSGMYATEIAAEVKFSKCPKCSHIKLIGVDECPSCGVYESKYLELQKVESPRLYELNKLWSKVVQNFNQDESHQFFIQKAQDQSALSYARQKYKEMKSVIGQDTLVEKYIRQIDARLELHVNQQMSAQRSIELADKNKISSLNGGGDLDGGVSFRRESSMNDGASLSAQIASSNKMQNQKSKYVIGDKSSQQASSQKSVWELSSKDIFILIAIFGTIVLIVNKAMKLYPNLNGLVVSVTVLSYGLGLYINKDKKLK